MDDTKYKAFLMAAEKGSMTAAADALGYTQSGITRMISSLEEELGFSLLIRQKSGVILSENGLLLLPKIRDIVHANKVVEEMSADILGSVKGTITIGCYYSISAMWMPRFLKAFVVRYPQVKINISEGGNLEMAEWLHEKSVDLGLCAKPRGDIDCDWIPLYKDRIVVWLPADYPEAGRRTFPVKELENYPFIHTSPNHDTDQDRLIREEKLNMDVRFSTKDGFTTFNMVEAGLGISFNQQLIAGRWKGNVAQLPLSPPKYVELGIAVPSLKDMSPTAERFIACVKETMGQLTGSGNSDS